jgi:hypothetical protein
MRAFAVEDGREQGCLHVASRRQHDPGVQEQLSGAVSQVKVAEVECESCCSLAVGCQLQPCVLVRCPGIVPDLLGPPCGELAALVQQLEALVLATGQSAASLPPAGASRRELYIQNRHPESSDGQRVLRTQDMVDLAVFGRTRKSQLRDLSVGATAPPGLDTEEIGSLVRQALARMASDFGFTGAESAQL